MVFVAAFVLAPSASAHDPAEPWGPAIDYPLYRPVAAPVEGDLVVQLEAPGRAWGVRRTARLMDAQIPGLTIRTTGTCAANPTAVCIRVELGTWTPEQQRLVTPTVEHAWAGVCLCGDDGRKLLLNRYMSDGSRVPMVERRRVAAHELGHALGLGHHRSRGVTSTVHTAEYVELSEAEVAVLVDWFAVPRYR